MSNNYRIPYKSTSNLITVFIPGIGPNQATLSQTIPTGSGKTGLAYNTTGLVAHYLAPGASALTSIALATMTLGTWVSGGFVEESSSSAPGSYQIGLPDAVAGAVGIVPLLLTGAVEMGDVQVNIEVVPPEEYYPDGLIYYSGSGTGGAIPGINGTMSNPCNAEADVFTLMGLTGIYACRLLYSSISNAFLLPVDPAINPAIKFIAEDQAALDLNGQEYTTYIQLQGGTLNNSGGGINSGTLSCADVQIDVSDGCSMYWCELGQFINMALTGTAPIVYWHMYSPNQGGQLHYNFQQADQSFRSWNGALTVYYMTSGSTLEIDGVGDVTIDSSCSGGVITYGPGINIIDQSGGANTLLSTDTILQLLGQNLGFRNATYDASGNLTAAKLFAYDTAAHATTNDGSTGVLHEWDIAGTFTGTNMTAQYTKRIS
jgi:hypothetical protein